MPQENIKKVLEKIKTLEEENSSLRLQLSKLEKRLEDAISTKKEINQLKEKILQLEKEIKEKPVKEKIKSVSVEQFLTDLSKSLAEFERGSQFTDKKFTVSDLSVELKTFINLEKNKVKFGIPEEFAGINPDILSRVSFKIYPVFAERPLEWIELPNLVGMKIDEGKERIKQLGLKLKVVEKESDFPKGTIVNQYPEPYTEVKKDVVVKLFVSKGKSS